MADAEVKMEIGATLSGLSLVDDSDLTLQEWYRRYKEMDANAWGEDSRLIRAVLQDTLDASEIEESIRTALETVRVEKGFCTGCSDMFNNWPTIGLKHGNHGVARKISTSEMEAARRKGCRCCAFILQQADADTMEAFRIIEKRLAVLGCSDTCSISVWNWGGNGHAQCLWVNLPGKIAEDSNTDLARLWKFDSYALSASTKINDEPVSQFDQAIAWLHGCDGSHDLCKSKSNSKSPAERPRRLVWIGDESIRLVLTETMPDEPHYATLSYCWGKSDFIRLTRGNMQDLLENIPEEQLPQTFKDAVFTARALDLQYIWIDSLCIVQGESNHLDWINESGKMRSVYGRAYVNIAATTATDVHKGFLAKASNYSGGFATRVSTRKYCSVRVFQARHVYDVSTSETHLATRAWALQERLLAPRTIYMGDYGLFCECRTTWLSEFLPDGSPQMTNTRLVIPEDTAWDWGKIVRLYSNAKLTNPADKLPALSGIARRQHEATGDHYLAGMWKEKLLRQLVWMCFEKGDRPQWRAPSWSWTSVDGSTEFYHGWRDWPDYDIGSDEYARVIDVWTTLAGPDPFGAVSDGELRIGCRSLISGCFSPSETQQGNAFTFTIETSEELFALWMDTNDDESIRAGETFILLPLIGGKTGCGRYDLKEKEDKVQDPRKDLPAESEFDPSDQEESESELGDYYSEDIFIRGLALRSLDRNLGQFQRIGSFEFVHEMLLREPDTKKDQYTEFIRVMQEVGASTAASWCAENLSDDDAHDMPYVIIIK